MGLLEGKNVLIMGIRNKWSIAWGIAKSCDAQGAKLIFTYRGERERESVEELLKDFPGCRAYACNVENEAEVDELFNNIKKEYKSLDGIVHCIAHAQKEDLKKDFLETSKEGYSHALDVTSYSLILVAKHAKKFNAKWRKYCNYKLLWG